jgi:hypothetical protein
MKHALQILAGKAHILVISLLLASFALSTANTSTPVTSRAAPHQKQQTITRLFASPATGVESQNSNAYDSEAPEAANGPYDAQDESQPSISSPSNDDLTPPPPDTNPGTTCSPCIFSSGCTASCPAPTPESGPIYGCGGCYSPPTYGYHPMQMCPMCAETAN